MCVNFLCKGKRKKNGEWVTGHYQQAVHILDKIEHLIYHYESYEDWEYAEIIPETCCQYSELLDKAHNGIWENDLVKEGLGRLYWNCPIWFAWKRVWMVYQMAFP